MGSCTPSGPEREPAASPEFLAAFRARAGRSGRMTFAEFMALALYDPAVGYYRRSRPRIGYGGETDFFTASTSGVIFGELIVAACVTLLGDANPGDFTFVEIGAEPGRSVLTGVRHPFADVRTLRVGDAIALGGRCVVFSNELFDAQPFRRFVFRERRWRELGVAANEGGLTDVELTGEVPSLLPPHAPDGYVLDAPLAAADLTGTLAQQAWTGLFVACDYGKSWRELREATPAGTARAYRRHAQSNDLLARPGEQDLTCHVCWDWLAESLQRHGFVEVAVESQEAFFVHHGGAFIAEVTAAEAARLSQRKLALMQLLHPAHLGQKFQVLHGRRG
jgi:SAM-dependent MidA family methyltransferase